MAVDQDIHTDLELRSFEAEEGTRRVIGFHAIERGAVETKRRLRLRIPPGLEDGTQLRVNGEGNEPGADSVAGDLFVHVHVLPPPKDRPWVRYIALALLLLAVAWLALYVVR